MPNAKILSEKQAIVETLAERLKGASSGVIVDYKGITVAEDTALRRELGAASVEYNVVKNTLTRFAAEKVGLGGIDDSLQGTTALATTTEDPIAPIRILGQYSDKMGKRFNIKTAFMDGQVLSESEIAEIAKLTGKNDLYAKVLGTMLAPITALAVCIGQIVEKNGGSVESAAEEAPAAEAEAAPAEEAPAAEAEAAPAAE